MIASAGSFTAVWSDAEEFAGAFHGHDFFALTIAFAQASEKRIISRELQTYAPPIDTEHWLTPDYLLLSILAIELSALREKPQNSFRQPVEAAGKSAGDESDMPAGTRKFQCH